MEKNYIEKLGIKAKDGNYELDDDAINILKEKYAKKQKHQLHRKIRFLRL